MHTFSTSIVHHALASHRANDPPAPHKLHRHATLGHDGAAPHDEQRQATTSALAGRCKTPTRGRLQGRSRAAAGSALLSRAQTPGQHGRKAGPGARAHRGLGAARRVPSRKQVTSQMIRLFLSLKFPESLGAHGISNRRRAGAGGLHALGGASPSTSPRSPACGHGPRVLPSCSSLAGCCVCCSSCRGPG